MHEVEEFLIAGVQWLKLGIEAVGALIIGIGLLIALWTLLRPLVTSAEMNFTLTRLTFARYLALALEFQLAADILSTAVAPSWDAIGKLAAIAVIRTGLNYFLTREMAQEAAEIEEEHRERQEGEVRTRAATGGRRGRRGETARDDRGSRGETGAASPSA